MRAKRAGYSAAKAHNVMSANDFGIEAATEEDRLYKGSRFQDVRAAIFANPYQKIWGAEGEPPLPHYDDAFECAAWASFVRPDA